jgi:hypothetical protein
MEARSEKVRVAVRIRNTDIRTNMPNVKRAQTANGNTPTLAIFDDEEIVAKPSEYSSNSITINDPESRKPAKEFAYDYLFSKDSSQKLIYDKTIKPIIDKCMEGYNGCIFAYGQTGSGKTYTMGGNDNIQERGIIPRVAEQIVAHIAQVMSTKPQEVEFTVTGSYLEIYQEQLCDLLYEGENRDRPELRIRIDPHSVSQKDLYVEGISEMLLVTENDYTKMIKTAMARRTVASTK